MRASVGTPPMSKRSAVAELEVQRLGDALLDADRAGLAVGPAPGDHLVVRGAGGRVRQVELAVHQALGAVIGEVVRRDGAPVHRHQAPADHGVPVVLAHARLAQRLLEGVGLLGHDVDDEAVGRIGRCGAAPAGDQVGAQQHQQHQRQQPHGQRADLHHGVARAGGDLARGQHQPARRGGLVDTGAQQLDGQPAQRRKQRHGARKAAHGDQAQGQVGADGQQQRGKACHAQPQHRQRGRLQATEIAPDHAQRRHLGQLQHRRQAEGHQQCESDAQAERGRPQAGRGQALSTRPASKTTNTWCTPKPIATPSRLAASPTRANSSV
jgi:hypothetical protein